MTLPARRFNATVGDSSNDLGNSGPGAIIADLTIPDQRTYDVVSPVHSNYGLATGGTASANTTAMNAAIADTLAGMTVLIPRGTYQVNAITWGSTNYTLQLDGILSLNAADTIPANVTVRVGQGGGFTRVAGDHLTINGQFSAGMHKVFTEATATNDWVVFGSGFTGSAIPQWWGAVGNGSTDDTDAFQQAINASLKVEVPATSSTYMVDGTGVQYGDDIRTVAGLVLRSGQRLIGVNRPTITVIANSFPGYTIFYVPPTADWVTIAGFNLIGDRDTHNYTPDPNPYATHEWGAGVLFHGSLFTLEDLYITGMTGDGVWVNSLETRTSPTYVGSVGGTIRKVHVHDCRRQGISVVNCEDLLIDDCYFTDIGVTNGTNPKYGIDLEGYRDGGITYRQPLNVKITNSRFSGCYSGSVNLYNSDRATVDNCHFTESATSVGSVGGPYASNSVVSNCYSIATLMLADRAAFNGGELNSRFLNCYVFGGGDGFGATDGTTVDGCIMDGCNSGVSVPSGSSAVVSNCRFYDFNIGGSTGRGVSVRGRARISGCTFYDLSGAAIRVLTNGTAEIVGNQIRYCYRGIDSDSDGACSIFSNYFDSEARSGFSYPIITSGAGHNSICGNTFNAPTATVAYLSGSSGSCNFQGNTVVNQAMAGTAITLVNGKHRVSGNTVINARTSGGGGAIAATGGSGHMIVDNVILQVGGFELNDGVKTSASSGSNIIIGNKVWSGAITTHATDTVRNNITSTQYPAQANPVLIGTVSASGDSYIYVAKQNITVERIDLVSSTGIASDATDYWTAQVANLTHAGNLLATAKSTNGNAVTADVIWSITPDQNATLVTGDVLELQLTKFNAGPDWTRLMVVVHARNTQ